MEIRRAFLREVVGGRAALRGLAALACVALAWGLLRLGAAAQQNRARFWLDRGSPAMAEYQRFRERFSATELHVLRLRLETVRETSRALTSELQAAPGVLEVVSPSQLDPGWRDLRTASLPYGCDSTGACYHRDDRRWARARGLHGPLSAELRLLEPATETAHLTVFARSQLDGAWGYNALDPPQSIYERAEHRRNPPAFAFLPRLHTWLENELWRPLLLGAVCLLAFRRHSWLVALAAVGTAALAAAASEAVLVATRRTASIAEPSAELVIFVLVLGAALHVLNLERTASWLSGADNPWRAERVGAGQSALGLGALALGSASFALLPVAGLQCFALQSAAGLLLGAALVSSLVPTLAAVLPRQKPPVAVPETTAAQGGARRQPWLLLGVVGAVGALLVWMLPAFQSFGGRVQWSSFVGFAFVLLGLPLALMSFRRGPAWLQRRWPLEPTRRLAEPLPRGRRAYVASLVVLYAIALPLLLTAAPGNADRLGPEAFARWDGSKEHSRRYSAVPLTRVELVLTTRESQLTESGLARLERLAARLKAKWPSFGVVEPSLLLREAAYQLERPAAPPGPWLADAGVAGRLLEQYVADDGHTTRMTLLAEPPPGLSPLAFAGALSLESVAWQVKEELPEADVTITGPERLVSEAAFDPLLLAALLVLAMGLASSFQRLSQRAVPAAG